MRACVRVCVCVCVTGRTSVECIRDDNVLARHMDHVGVESDQTHHISLTTNWRSADVFAGHKLN